MAKLIGILKMGGSLDNFTFVNTKNGCFVRTKSGPSKERMRKDETYARVRENGQEFGRAAKAGKLLRFAFACMFEPDALLVGRMLKLLMQCLKLDKTSDLGCRTLVKGALPLLIGFEFNLARPLSTMLNIPLNSTVDRATGTVGLAIPAFIPANIPSIPTGATHYRLNTRAAALDFDKENFESDDSESAYLPINNQLSAPLTLSVSLTPNSTLPIIQVLGIQFFEEINGRQHPINESGGCALSIVNVEV